MIDNSAVRMTNIHTITDTLGTVIGGLLYRKNRLFSRSLEAKPLREAVSATRVIVGSLEPDVWHPVVAETAVEKFTAAYRVHQWQRSKSPTILFVHGSGEQSANFGRFSSNSFRSMFCNGFGKDMNLIQLMAPFHDTTQGDYIQAMGDLANYVGMLAVSTALVDALAARIKEETSAPVYVVGISLGGWVANLHRAFYNRHVDLYIPMIAGARLDQVFTASAYRRMTDPGAHEKKNHLQNVLDFEKEFKSIQDNNCRPLLARYDTMIELKTQKSAYEGMDLVVMNRGHFTGIMAVQDHRAHIARSVEIHASAHWTDREKQTESK